MALPAGTREMDLILERFLAAAGDGMDEETRQGLERLLDQSDQDILDWISGGPLRRTPCSPPSWTKSGPHRPPSTVNGLTVLS